MSLAENKASVEQWIEKVINQGNLAAVDEFFAADLLNHAALPGMSSDQEGLKQLLGLYLMAFPDFHADIEDQVAEGDKVVTSYTTRGTHQGAFIGIPPTGKHVSWPTMSTCRFSDGKIVELWVLSDTLGLLQQLGAVPALG